jgi:hypothetical protein
MSEANLGGRDREHTSRTSKLDVSFRREDRFKTEALPQARRHRNESADSDAED